MLVHQALSSPSRRRPKSIGGFPGGSDLKIPLHRARCRGDAVPSSHGLLIFSPLPPGMLCKGTLLSLRSASIFGMTNAYGCLLAIFSPFFTTKTEAKEKKKSPFE